MEHSWYLEDDMAAIIDRRAFLKRTAATSIILGFPFLGRRGLAGPGPDPDVDRLALEAALRRMKAELKPGVVILVPGDPGDAKLLAADLTKLLTESEGAVRQIFCRAVFVCLASGEAAGHFPELKPGAAAICLDPDGKPTGSIPRAPGLFRREFAATVAKAIDGKDEERLTALAGAQRAALGDEASKNVDALLSELGSEEFGRRSAASDALFARAERTTAILADSQRRTTDPETRYRIAGVFERLFSESTDEREGPRLPYGAAWEAEPELGGCGGGGGGGNAPAPACGLAVAPVKARKFLKFLIRSNPAK